MEEFAEYLVETYCKNKFVKGNHDFIQHIVNCLEIDLNLINKINYRIHRYPDLIYYGIERNLYHNLDSNYIDDDNLDYNTAEEQDDEYHQLVNDVRIFLIKL